MTNLLRLLGVVIKPFGDNTLSLDTYLIPTYSRLRSSEISYDRSSLYGEFSLTAQHKGLQLYYKYALPTYTYDSGYASRMEPKHTASISYRLGNWKFSASMLFIGTPAYYHTIRSESASSRGIIRRGSMPIRI